MITVSGEASSWVRAHWRGLALVGSWLACVGLGWALHRPPPAPAVHLAQDDHATSSSSSSSAAEKHEGPKHIVHLEFGPEAAPKAGPSAVACRPVRLPGEPYPVYVPAGEQVTSETIEDDGPVDTHAVAATEQHAEADHHLQLAITPPAARPGWELQLGLEGGLSLASARVAVRRRLVGDLWVEVSAEPLQRQLGAAVAFAF